MGFRRIAAALAALLAGLVFLLHESGQSAGDNSPDHIATSYRELSLVCLLRPLCPVTSEALAAMKGALAGHRAPNTTSP